MQRSISLKGWVINSKNQGWIFKIMAKIISVIVLHKQSRRSKCALLIGINYNDRGKLNKH